MSVLLPAGLPGGFTVEPATVAHVAEAFEVVAAEQTAAFGFCVDSAEDVRSILDPSPAAATTRQLVRHADGAVVQLWVGYRGPDDPISHVWIATHPALPDAVSDQLARSGYALLLDWARAHAPEGDDDLQVHAGCPAGSPASPRHLEQAGFTRERTFWEMFGPVTDETRTPPEVPGLVIENSTDVAAIHGVFNEAFVGHYGFSPMSLDDWLAVEKTEPGFDPDLRYLATVDGAPAAAMTLLRRLQSEGAMYVGELATVERFRRRGIAAALLAHAFEIAAREGLGQLSLHVDSENSHAAPSVYRRAGLEVRAAFWGYARTLPR